MRYESTNGFEIFQDQNSLKKEKPKIWELFESSRCGRSLYDEKYCIFHSKKIEDKIESFNVEFNKELDRQNKITGNKEIRFDGFIFPGDMIFEKMEFEKEVSFDHAFFAGKTSFNETKFKNGLSCTNTHFSGDVIFSKSKIKGASFHFVQFDEAAEFGSSVFRGGVVFWKCKLKGGSRFKDTQFKKPVLFFDTVFNGVVFSEADFKDEVRFIESKFFIQATFQNAKFEKLSIFKKVIFNCYTCFQNAKFNRHAFFNEVDFKGETSFLEACFQGGIISFYESKLEDVKYLFESLKRKWSLFRKPYRLRDFLFYLGEKSSNRYPQIFRMSKDEWYLRDFKRKNPVIYQIWRISSNCGRSFLIWLVWSLFISFCFAVFYMVSYNQNPSSFFFQYPPESFLTFTYYSVVTFTTLGFGDIIPASEGLKIVVMIEVILGYIMLGGLISIFANKLARRS